MTPLFGREAQLAQWDDALTTGGALTLRGEPGIGKSRLVTEFARIARAHGRTVLRGRTLTEALLPVTRRGWPDLPACYREALGDLVPEWRTGRPVSPDVLAEAVVRLLHAVDGVLLLDDTAVHPHLAANAVVVTTERACAGTGLVPRLSDDAAAALVDALGGRPAVLDRAEGLPLAIVELCVTGGSPTLEAFTRTALAALSPAAAEVAHAAAVVDDVLTWREVQPLTGLDPDTVAAALDDLAAAHLLTGNRFRHGLIRDAVLACASPSRSARTWVALGRHRLARRSPLEASLAASRAVELAPTNDIRAAAVDTLTAALVELGRFEEALAHLATTPPTADTRARAARCAVELGDLRPAELRDGTELLLAARQAMTGDPADAVEPLALLRCIPGWQWRADLELGVVDCLTVVSPFRLHQARPHARGALLTLADHHLRTAGVLCGDPVELPPATAELWHALLAADLAGALHYADALTSFPETRGIRALLSTVDRNDLSAAASLLDEGVGSWTNRGLARLAFGDDRAWDDLDRSPFLAAVAAVLVQDASRAAAAHGAFVSLGNTPWRRRCEKVMREAGIPIPRRGRGDASVPAHLRALGVTSREMDVLLLIAQGATNGEIAVKLSVSRRTVDTHVRNLLAKTGSTRRTNLSALV
ncbi:LuxR C-terminal-related transcriptional regulator [Lentzea sp. NPDC004782]|uniref:LuxR C-terminal-related transcriptional regulator n=1 Tax=Lentzea sp. NPDC004782 TaxID=3154458 RepID=UPI0033AD6522